MIVLDTSMVGSLVLPDERQVTAEAVATLFDSAIVVPTHWRLEVASMVRSAMLRGRIDAVTRDAILEGLAGLTVDVDRETWAMAWSRTIEISDRHGLTPCDAAYIELAERVGGTLATLDRAMIAVAQRRSIPLLAIA